MIQKIHDLARNQGFLRLHRELNKFNIFHATGMRNQEIKHTQFLGYLLDPNESHGFKDEFLIRFIQSLPKSDGEEKVEINILDFNLSYSKTIKEKTFGGIKNRLDLLIEIPSLEESGKLYVIAVENKIKAKASSNQLKTYREAIKDAYRDKLKGNPILLYLNINNEEPNDDAWIPILYSETIIQAIRSLIDDLKDTLSDYMLFILNDYIEFINKEGGYESDDPLEKITSEIDSTTINNAKEISAANPKSIEHQRLEIRYQKALSYIVSYDADPRKELLAYFISQFNKDGVLNKIDSYPFRLESSNRSWMRFSFLSNENRDQLKEICKNPTRGWLSSQCNLAFEFSFNWSNENNKIDCYVSLILGPTGSEYKNRNKILQKLRLIFNQEHDLKSDPTAEARDHFDAIKKGAYQKYRKIGCSHDEARQWITDTLSKIAKDEIKFITNVNINLFPLPEQGN